MPPRLEIADMLAEEHLASDADGDGVLQVRAEGQHLAQRFPHHDRQGRISASAAHHDFAAVLHARHGIVAGPHDGAIVHGEAIGNAAQAFGSFVIVGGDRFVAQVSAGGDDRKSAAFQQERVQRRVRQHGADIRRRHGNFGRQHPATTCACARARWARRCSSAGFPPARLSSHSERTVRCRETSRQTASPRDAFSHAEFAPRLRFRASHSN